MGDPFLSEIRMMGFSFAPRGWAFCNGQILQINQNQALFSLVGTSFGGDGRTTFALPNLKGTTPIHMGQNGATNYPLAQQAGEATHKLSTTEMPQHTHLLQASTNAAGSPYPEANGKLAVAVGLQPYAATVTGSPVPMADGIVSQSGGGQAHQNMQPYLVVNFCIALSGLFPSRN